LPELPEVETIRRDLDAHVTGRTVRAVDVAGGRSVRRHASPADVRARVAGRTITSTGRHGKYLLLWLARPGVAHVDGGGAGLAAGARSGAPAAAGAGPGARPAAGARPVARPAGTAGRECLVVHLGMSGQLLLADAASPRPRHTHVALGLTGDTELRFVDPRTFGEVFASAAAEPGGLPPELAHLGPDALDELTTARRLARVLGSRRRKLKDLLMDQTAIAGIGNIYSDEILWSARLRHDRSSASLSPAEVSRLASALRSTLRDAVAHRGSSLGDEQYRDLLGRVGGYASRHRAYDREGRPCPRCRQPIVRLAMGGRSHFFCPRCQL